MNKGLHYIVASVLLVLLPLSLADSDYPYNSYVDFQVGGAGYTNLCSNSNLEVIGCVVGDESTPDSTVCAAGEGGVDIRYRKNCETQGEETIVYASNPIYNINWDNDQTDCECNGGTWYSGAAYCGSLGCAGGSCCGDDGSADDFCVSGYTACYDGSSFTDGDSNSFTCQCGSGGAWDGTCDNGDDQCWDSAAGKCCGDDDNSNDYFSTTNVGGCIPIGGNAVYDTVAPVISGITSNTDDAFYFNQTGALTGTVYFNSATASGQPVIFTLNWTDANSGYGEDDINAIKTGGLNGGVGSSSNIEPPGTLTYTFSSADSDGTLYIYVRDAAGLNDTGTIIFQEDTAEPTGTITINSGASATSDRHVNISMTYSDNIEVMECAYSNDDLMWTAWEPCQPSRTWSLLEIDGERTVFYRIKDIAGNVLEINDSIYLDVTQPQVFVNDNASFTNSAEVNVTFGFEDMIGSPVTCSYKNDSMDWTPWEPCPTSPDPLRPEIPWSLEGLDGTRTFSMRTNTSFNTIKENNDTIVLDTQYPTGSITLWAINVPGMQESNNQTTAYTTVNMVLEYEDNEGVSACRFANDHAENFTPWEDCETLKTWILDEEDGIKTVFYQIRDYANNIQQYNDTIYLNKTGAGLDNTPPNAPVVEDDGDWTNDDTSIHAEWSGASDPQSDILNIPLVYNVSLNSSTNSSVCGWTYVDTDNEITFNSANCPGISLDEGKTYYFNVRVINSGGITNDSASDGIGIDTEPCQITSLLSTTHDNNTWNAKSQNNSPEFSWSGSGGVSGMYGYSYVLDQSRHTTPDIIPEGDLGNLVSETSVFYDNIIDGNLTFHVMCRDNAGNWGSAEHFHVNIDTSPPTTPQLGYRTVQTNATNYTFSWTASVEEHSLPVTYVFELFNSSNMTADGLVNRTNTTSPFITIADMDDKIYYPRVIAWNAAGLNSSFSSEVSTVIDEVGPYIDIIIPGSGCPVATLSPVVRVRTDEKAYCEYRKNASDVQQPEFDYTGSMYHETKAGMPGDDSYILYVECRDEIGNTESATRIFTTDSTASPASISIFPESGYYTGLKSEVLVNTGNLGGIDDSEFTAGLNRSAIEFAVTDIGCGNYTLTFTAPEKDGLYDLQVNLSTATDTEIVDVNNLEFTMSFMSSGIDAKDLDKVVYSSSGNYTVGIATESYSAEMDSGSSNLNLTSNSYDGSGFIFGAGSGRYAKAADKRLEEGTFSEQINPNFGSDVKEVMYSNSINVGYDYAQIYGIEQLMPGRHNILIRNMGTNATTGKEMIEISVR